MNDALKDALTLESRRIGVNAQTLEEDIAEAICLSHGNLMHVKDIAAYLLWKGRKVSRKHLLHTLAKMVKEKKIFRADGYKRGYYWGDHYLSAEFVKGLDAVGVVGGGSGP